ncbi:MAG: hypothetical protein IIW03_03450, partial [Clostridia bacterium]|nr:hypothetical protein [Clostridia bacterium]
NRKFHLIRVLLCKTHLPLKGKASSKTFVLNQSITKHFSFCNKPYFVFVHRLTSFEPRDYRVVFIIKNATLLLQGGNNFLSVCF